MSQDDDFEHEFRLRLGVDDEINLSDVFDLIEAGGGNGEIDITEVDTAGPEPGMATDERLVNVVVVSHLALDIGDIYERVVPDLKAVGVDVRSVMLESDDDDDDTPVTPVSPTRRSVIGFPTQGGYTMVCPNHLVSFEEGGQCPYGDYP